MNKKILILILGVVLFVSAAGGSFYIGYLTGFNETRIIEIRGVADINPLEEVKADFGVFWQAWDKLKNIHIRGAELNHQDLVYGAIEGLLQSVKDSNTVFFTPEETKKFNENIAGVFGGIGAELGKKDNNIIIITPLKNSPAEKAGLKPQDIILKVNNEDFAGFSVYEAVKIIRGEPGTKIKLLINRKGFTTPKEFEITRELIRVPTVEWEMLDDKIAHIKIYTFNPQTPKVFYQAVVDTVLNKKANKIILDLRNNPGGYLDVAVTIAGWFLGRGEPVVIEQKTEGEERTIYSRGNGFLKNYPTVILINKGTASASEILAGALRDQLDIKLVGEKSFGKGTVQQLESLKDGSSIKITIAYWLTPKRMKIEQNGLVPNYIIEENDQQLKKAIELLKSL